MSCLCSVGDRHDRQTTAIAEQCTNQNTELWRRTSAGIERLWHQHKRLALGQNNEWRDVPAHNNRSCGFAADQEFLAGLASVPA